MNTGYIKLWRTLEDSWLIKKPEYFTIWCWLLIRSCHKKQFVNVSVGKGSSVIELQRGELMIGRKTASEKLGLTESQIYRALKKFEKVGMITQKSNNHFTIVSICNYDTYQDSNSDIEQLLNSQRTAIEQPLNTYKNDNKEKNDKKNTSRSAKSEFSEDVLSIYNAYPLKKSRGAALSAIQKSIAHLKSDPKLISDFLANKNLSKEQLEKYSEPVNFLKRRVEHFVVSQVGKDKQFIKHPATWFNQECYLDEMELQPTQVYYEKRNY